MQRRKFIIGAGALTTGSAAAAGSGAFSTAEAQRDVTVAVATDADAFLSLDALDSPNADQYVSSEDGTIEIAIGDSGAGGSGVNTNALTEFEDLFAVTNQGTQPVAFFIQYDPDDGQGDFPQVDGEPGIVPEPEGDQDLEFFDTDGGLVLNYPVDQSANATLLDTGESAEVGLRIDTRNVDLDDSEPLFDGELIVRAVGSE